MTVYIFWNHFLSSYLFISSSFLLFRDLLIDIEDTRDIELHTVEVISNHSPQLVQTRVTGLCNLQMTKNPRLYEDQNRCLSGNFKTVMIWPHLHNLPGHVQDAACCSTEEISQASGGTTSDHTSTHRLSFTIQQLPLLPPLFPLPQLQLPLFFMVTEPH